MVSRRVCWLILLIALISLCGAVYLLTRDLAFLPRFLAYLGFMFIFFYCIFKFVPPLLEKRYRWS